MSEYDDPPADRLIWPDMYIVRTTAGRFITVPLSTVAESGTELVSIQTNGLAPGTVACIDSSGNLQAASCDSLAASLAVGIVESENTLRLNGIWETDSLTPGELYFLGIGGAFTTDAPTDTGHVVVRVGIGLPAGLMLQIQEVVIL